MANRTKLGAHFASPLHHDGKWEDNLASFAHAKFPAAKVMIPPGFGWDPGHVEQLIDAGAREIILRTEDDDYTHQRVRTELVDRGFYRLIERYGGVQFILEIGNEQNLARDSHGNPRPLDPWVGRFYQLQTRHLLRDLDRSNLTWIASMPTDIKEVDIYLSRTNEAFHGGKVDLKSIYDGFGAHIYGHFDLVRTAAENSPGGASQWLDIISVLKSHSSLPIYITEFGINHMFSDKSEKGRRYLDWIESVNPEIHPSAYIYWLGTGERHPSYQITAEMADMIREYHKVVNQPPPEDPEIPVDPEPPDPYLTMGDAVRQLQHWAKRMDPTFEPVDFKE